MTLTEKPQPRENRWLDRAPYREWCPACRRPGSGCYCALIEPFASEPRFVIATQPREAKHRFGTGRIAHRCLSNSLLLEGVDFSHHGRVNDEIHNPTNYPMLLHAAGHAINLSHLTYAERAVLIPRGQKLVVFVLDGTWKSVRKMIRLSCNLAHLPAICFDPPSPSAYRIRRQPRPHCYSTLEAIHQVIDLLSLPGGEDLTATRAHDRMLAVFQSVIARQLAYLS